MKNEELLYTLEKQNAGETSEDVIEEKLVKFLIFSMQNKHYAIPAELVREIVFDVPLFYLPFVPPYVRGLINRHGEPYSVIDLKIVFEKEPLDSSKFLILKINNDQAALIITDVIEIKNIPESGVHSISDHEEQNNYFAGAVTIEETEVLIINVQSIIQQLAEDVESA